MHKDLRLDVEARSRVLQFEVPTTFDEMFRFNAAVMGMGDREWMYEVLDCFDAIVRNIANSFRLQELARVTGKSLNERFYGGICLPQPL